jgi:hypothetical protein
MPHTVTPLVCEECKRADRDGHAHGWRAYIVDGRLITYCPSCWSREFGDSPRQIETAPRVSAQRGFA